ncbi:MAG TPA: ABC transporter permease [Saprospiraceae bacterium]|nr:ABC transporter permease [Saprospiraceae bacterium]HMP24772.1 ABC transporter permease [Saprospiraceae bacterium]
MDFLENVRLALNSIRGNILRSVLTLMIIAFGIMALVGILTAIDSAIYSLSDNLSSLGANSFDIVPRDSRGRRGGVQEKRGENFTYKQAMDFKEAFNFPAQTSVSMNCSSNAAIRYGEEKTNPNVRVSGIDEAYLDTKGIEVELGRNFNTREALNGSNIAIIGKDIVKLLFKDNAEKALDQVISVGNIKLKVIGVLKSRGSSINQSEDRQVLIPLQTGKRYFGSDRTNYNILVAVNDATEIDNATAEATGLLRNIRRLKAAEENDFEITKSDSLIGIIRENTVYFRLAAVGIGLITLIGAAIGLMNIMLVSVTERTREIGICKAIGATRQSIMTQFLTEAVLISLLGGLLGIVLGVLIGNVVTYLMGGNFLFPWAWITIAVITCTVVGLVSGLYPALKAARLDPIESLRYE